MIVLVDRAGGRRAEAGHARLRDAGHDAPSTRSASRPPACWRWSRSPAPPWARCCGAGMARPLRAARGDPAVGADVHRHRDLRRDAGLRLEPGDVLPDGRLGRRPAADHLHADGRNRARRAPRLAAGGAGRRRHLGRLPAGGGLGGAAGADVQLARAVAAGPADRLADRLPRPLHPGIAALPVQRGARERGARRARELRRRGARRSADDAPAAGAWSTSSSAGRRHARSCCAAAMRASPGA